MPAANTDPAAVTNFPMMTAPTIARTSKGWSNTTRMSINMPTDLNPDKLTPEARKVREEFRERFRKIAGYYPPAFAAVGFDGAWALFKYVLPKAGRMDPDAIRSGSKPPPWSRTRTPIHPCPARSTTLARGTRACRATNLSGTPQWRADITKRCIQRVGQRLGRATGSPKRCSGTRLAR